jgi:predicted sulfurtransferase
MPHRNRTVLLLLALLLLVAGACQPRALAPGEIPTHEDQVPRITPEELKARLDAREKIVIVDSRAQKPYDVRHIAGAISMPLAQVEERADELPKNRTIVFYCT